MQHSKDKIIIFARAPVLGQVKTRLAADIGPQQALSAYRGLLQRTLEQALQVGAVKLCCYTDDCQHSFFQPWQQKGVRVAQQQGTDLGERMYHAMQQEMLDATNVVLLGADCPVMSTEIITNALSVLHQGFQTVLVPVQDGGYILIGCHQLVEVRLFSDIAWSTQQVLAQTQRHLQQLGQAYSVQPALWDVDNLADYRHWLSIGQ